MTVVQHSSEGRKGEIRQYARICVWCAQEFHTTDGRVRLCSCGCVKERRRSNLAKRQAAYRDRHPERDRCRQILKNAINNGHVRRCTRCERCGAEGPMQAHHEDYSRPFFVEWLCVACHAGLDEGRHFGCGAGRQGDDVAVSVDETFQDGAAAVEFGTRGHHVEDGAGKVGMAAHR